MRDYSCQSINSSPAHTRKGSFNSIVLTLAEHHWNVIGGQLIGAFHTDDHRATTARIGQGFDAVILSFFANTDRVAHSSPG